MCSNVYLKNVGWFNLKETSIHLLETEPTIQCRYILPFYVDVFPKVVKVDQMEDTDCGSSGLLRGLL